MAGRWILDNKLAAAALSFGAYTLVMAGLERRMRATGGPGIVPFELVGNASRAEDIMTKWGADGQRAARTSLWLDFGYMSTYGLLLALLLDRARLRRRHPRAVMVPAVVAVAGDAVEGISLLKVLDRREPDVHARRATTAALIKFAALFGALGYVVADQFHGSEPH